MNSGSHSSTSYLINSVEKKVSPNDNEDFIKKRLERLEIAYFVMQRHPNILDEFISTVKGDANPQASELTAPEIAH
jgi:hypothetical protein